MFFLASFSGSLFLIFLRFHAKRSDFGTPLGSSWDQNGDPNRPSGAKITPFSLRWSSLCALLAPTGFQDRFRSAPGHHFGRFGGDCLIIYRLLMDFGSLQASFFYDFLKISASIFVLTLQVAKNRQEPAKNPQRTRHTNDFLKT